MTKITTPAMIQRAQAYAIAHGKDPSNVYGINPFQPKAPAIAARPPAPAPAPQTLAGHFRAQGREVTPAMQRMSNLLAARGIKVNSVKVRDKPEDSQPSSSGFAAIRRLFAAMNSRRTAPPPTPADKAEGLRRLNLAPFRRSGLF